MVKTNISISVMIVDDTYYNRFIDISHSIRCSIAARHKVVKQPLNNSNREGNKIVSAIGNRQSDGNTLNYPHGNLSISMMICKWQIVTIIEFNCFIQERKMEQQSWMKRRQNRFYSNVQLELYSMQIVIYSL